MELYGPCIDGELNDGSIFTGEWAIPWGWREGKEEGVVLLRVRAYSHACHATRCATLKPRVSSSGGTRHASPAGALSLHAVAVVIRREAARAQDEAPATAAPFLPFHNTFATTRR